MSRRGEAAVGPVLSVFAALLFVPVLPLQMLGYLGTCTQNDTASFLTGVVLSTPFALASLVLAALSARRMGGRPSLHGHAMGGLSSIVLAGLAGLATLMNLRLTWDTLSRGLSPCGADHSDVGHLFEPEHVLIGGTYGLVPGIVLIVAAFGVRAGLPTKVPRG